MTAPKMSSPAVYRLENFHITFLAVVMGMAGYTLAMQKASEYLPALHSISTILLGITLVLFVLVLGTYLLKCALHPAAVKSEMTHPVKINFFPLLPMIFLLLANIMLERSMAVSFYCWIIGVVLQLFASLVVISEWIKHERFKIEHMNPAWFIPVVGFILVPMAGIRHGFPEISWFFLSVGVLFWLALMVIVFYRMFFHAPIASRLLPTLFMLFAPPAVAFIAYHRLSGGQLDLVSRGLFYFSLYLFMVVLLQLPRLLKIPFFLSWWASSFPLAAMTLATFVFSDLIQSRSLAILGWIQLSFLSFVILFLVARTLIAIRGAELCVED